jgi:hypothetical protein
MSALCQSRHLASQQNNSLFDHLVGAGKQRRRYGVIPSALAVLRLTISLYFVEACTGDRLASRPWDAVDVNRGATVLISGFPSERDTAKIGVIKCAGPSPLAFAAIDVAVPDCTTSLTQAEATAFSRLDLHRIVVKLAWRHEHVSAITMLQPRRMSKLMDPYDVAEVRFHLSHNHRFGKPPRSPRASHNHFASSRPSLAEVDLLNNLDVSTLAVDCFEMVCVVYYFWCARRKVSDQTIQSEAHIAPIVFFQKPRRPLQDIANLGFSEIDARVLANGQRVHDFRKRALRIGWLAPQQQTQAYDRNNGLHVSSPALPNARVHMSAPTSMFSLENTITRNAV